jgi:methylmalonyl-CoA decarboxylase
MEIFLTGRAYDSETCLRMGLVNHVVEDGELETFTHDMAGELASNAPLSMWGTKKALHGISAYPVLPQDEEEAIRSLFIRSLKSRDLQEGQRAFAEKRKPVFTGE